jgi:adenine-specific DNA methylase
MIPKECKRLAEVDFPIAVVSKHAAREKSIRHGHPSTLHLWWARRPLAACRAMLLCLLLPDPCDPYCPEDFKREARRLLPRITGEVSSKDDDLRKSLLKFIGDFANCDMSGHPVYLEVGRGLVKAAHREDLPLVADTFAGGGSIPLEALRLGCDVFASDLNPVACLILKVLLEDIPRYGPALIKELQKVGTEIKRQAEQELAQFYPKDMDGATPIAYLWARTVRCESPNCGAEIPLLRSFWLCKKTNRKRALKHKVFCSQGKPPYVDFEIFEPRTEKEVHAGTVTQAKVKCLCCKAILTPERVRLQLAGQQGGADATFDDAGKRNGGARIIAVVTTHPDMQGRQYRAPTDDDYLTIKKAQERLQWILREWDRGGRKGLCPIPDEPISLNEIRRVSVPLYGATKWGDIFTARQKLCLHTYALSIRNSNPSESCSRLCSLALDRLLIMLSAHCRWKPTGETLIDMFGRHAIGMVWDFAESTPGAGDENTFSTWVEKYVTLVRTMVSLRVKPGQIEQSDASNIGLPDESCHVWFTDPPYYDSIPYAHLSDCFYVWLRRSLPQSVTSVDFSGSLTPKDAECVVDRPHRLSTSQKDEKYFERKIAEAASAGRKILSDSGCASIVFAHKTTEGWEALLSGIIAGGWCITASWPIATELTSRLNARDTASLATSVHLVCRPRPEETSVGDWAEVIRELPGRVSDWMVRLQSEGVRGADLVFACIGPALEIFSRYRTVEAADGREVKLGEYLEKVWEVVGREALRQVLGTDSPNVYGEDARLTALFLWTLNASNGSRQINGDNSLESSNESSFELDDSQTKNTSNYALPYDIVRRFCLPLGIHLDNWVGRIVEINKGIVYLTLVKDRAGQLLGKSVSSDLKLAKPKTARQLSLFDLLNVAEEQNKQDAARHRIEKVTWSRLHQDSIPTLDHVHSAMLLQLQGRSTALRELLFYEKQYRPEFLPLANALSALYPAGSEEKRLLDAMLLAVPR